MKRFWKILLISLGSLLVLIFAATGIALWFIFTPEKLTPIVGRQVEKFVSCQADIDRVELTFFSTFPKLGLRIDGVRLINPLEGSPTDTLLTLGRVNAVADVKAFLRNDELILSDIVLSDGSVSLFTDSVGRINYDILTLEDSDETESEGGGFSISYVDADNINIRNVDVSYTDESSMTSAYITGLSTVVRGTMKDGLLRGSVVSKPFDVNFTSGSFDSLIGVSIKGIGLDAKGVIAGDIVEAELMMTTAATDFSYGGEQYLTDVMVGLSAVLSADLGEQSASVSSSLLSVNDLEVRLNGSVRNDTVGGLRLDIGFGLGKWPIASLVALAPSSFTHYLDGIDMDGIVSSEGTVRGVYSEDVMPMIDAHVVFGDGRVAYPTMLPYQLSNIAADIEIHTDLSDDAASFVRVNTVRASTPGSVLQAAGLVNRLFSDPRIDISVDLRGDLADIDPFLPEDKYIELKGTGTGKLKANVRLSQIEKMELEKIIASGSILFSGLEARYDTVSVFSPSLKIDFSLPNDMPSTRNASFAAVSVVSERVEARMTDGTEVSFADLRFAVETSDIRDTLSIPAVGCDFSMSRISGSMEDIGVSINSPAGKISMEPGRRDSTVPRFKVRYNSEETVAALAEMNAVAENIDIDAHFIYDRYRQDFWEMITPSGAFSTKGAVFEVPHLNYPVELPELSMDFTPRKVDIEKVHVKLNRSDFSLDGYLDNVLPYFRGDSVLRGDFNFTSPVADIAQLLALTSGIGTDEARTEGTKADEFTGPYMVPEGIDLTLHASIDKALWYGEDVSDIKEFSKIRGDITIRDGVVFMTPDLTFSSPATNGEIMLKYQTPRRNHLYAGVLLHLTDMDIAEALDLIPELDTIMPMLRSFEGNAEFHLLAEGYMDSTYRFKLSTLEGACSISASDLVLKDEELFRTVAKFMKYKDEGVIRVDTLAADFSVSGDVVTLYPFLFSIDRYKAVISGNHNLDMSFNYNISLVQSPIPFRVAVDIMGTPEKMKFKLFKKSRYPDFYRPKRAEEVETREMQLRRQIREEVLSIPATRTE